MNPPNDWPNDAQLIDVVNGCYFYVLNPHYAYYTVTSPSICWSWNNGYVLYRPGEEAVHCASMIEAVWTAASENFDEYNLILLTSKKIDMICAQESEDEQNAIAAEAYY